MSDEDRALSTREKFSIMVDDRTVEAIPGQSVAAALIAAGVTSWRTTRQDGRPRGLFCGIGACFDCLIKIDDAPPVRACLEPVRPGMIVRSAEGGSDQDGAPGGIGLGTSTSSVRGGSDPVAVVGAGPAGLTAAVELASAGLPVILVDAGPRPGGQYWRQSADGSGSVDPRFRRLRQRLDQLCRDGLIDYRAGREVWLITAESGSWRVELRPTAATATPQRESVLAERLVLCPGGQDRQLPVPGWDLPGVYAAGGLQALLKEHHTLPGRRVLVAGTGPFLLPVATGLARAGAEMVAVCEANAPTRWLRSAPAVAAVPSKIIEGARYAAALGRRRIPYRTRTIVGEIRGDDRVQSVRLDRIDHTGSVVRAGIAELEVDAVGLGWGFTPSLELIMMVGAATKISADGSLVTEVDGGQRTSVPGVYVAGEACGVGGAVLAAAEGELAALTLLADHTSRSANPDPRLLRRIRRYRAFAAAMHRSHPIPSHWPDWCTADTLLCRCEEITLGDAGYAAKELGAIAARDYKLFARCGMGWCQGRICGPNVAGLAARLAGRLINEEDLRAMAKRTLAAPVPLGELAALATDQDDGES